MKILVRTNEKGRVEVVDRETGKIVENIRRVDVYINWRGTPTVTIEFNDIQLNIESIESQTNANTG